MILQHRRRASLRLASQAADVRHVAEQASERLIAATLASGVLASAERRQNHLDAVRVYRSILAELRKPSED